MAVESGYWTSCERANCGLEVFLIFCSKANFHWYHLDVSPFLQPFVKRLVMWDWRLKYFINQCFSQCVVQWLVENSSNPSYPITLVLYSLQVFSFFPPSLYLFTFTTIWKRSWAGREGPAAIFENLIIVVKLSSAKCYWINWTFNDPRGGPGAYGLAKRRVSLQFVLFCQIKYVKHPESFI